MKVTILAIDLAKDVFQLHGNDESGHCVLKRRLRRSELLEFMTNIPLCTVAMEACSTSNYWGREFRRLGHEVRLISPQFVKPFVKTNKNDSADAEAIAEAAVRPSMRFVPVKELWQQELQALHRARSLLVQQRVALTNALRGFLREMGFVCASGDKSLNELISSLLADEEKFSGVFRDLLIRLSDAVAMTQDQVSALEVQLKAIAKKDVSCVRIQKIPGVGPITATALIAAIGDAKNFKNGRNLSAWLGLVPKQRSSGNKDQLLGISIRGDGYLRSLLIHGARAVIQFAEGKEDLRSKWALRKVNERGKNKAVVALANRNARVIWALLARNQEYREPVAA